MSNDYRRITGLFKKYWTNEPLANATIIIRLLTNSFTLEAGYPKTTTPGNANDPGRSFQTDEDGNLPEGLELFCSGASVGGATKYRVTEPDGFEWDFILTYGDGTPISMQTLRAGGLPASDPETILALIEQKVAEALVRFDIPQVLSPEQKEQAKENLGITDGGGSAESPLMLTANDEDETPLTIEQFASQTAAPIIVKDSGGNSYFLIEAAGYGSSIRLRGGYDVNGFVANEQGIRLYDTGAGGELKIETSPGNTAPRFHTNRGKFTFTKSIVLDGIAFGETNGTVGFVLRSANGTLWKYTAANDGEFIKTEFV